MSRHRFQVWAAVGALLVLVCLGGEVLTARQEPTKPNPQPPAEQDKKGGSQGPPAKQEKKKAEGEIALDKMFEAFDLKPHGLPAIPDNPPPHEGAMIDYPIVIEPPDLVLIEVLEALPGRPISGERLVRPDGKISLGFYGEVHIAGLTVEQAKVKILKHLRKVLSDESLGLYETEFEEWGDQPPAPPANMNPFQPDQDRTPKDKAKKAGVVPSGRRIRWIRRRREHGSADGRARLGAGIRLLARRQEKDEKRTEEPQKQVQVPVEAGGQVTITIEVQNRQGQGEKPPIEIEPPAAIEAALGPPIPPAQTDRVFVDITAYNSKDYYVLGDVGAPGKLPFTGRETVMDALQYASGFLPTAETKDVHLVRPARAGKPARVYKVDVEAIRDRGDVTTNYQLFPGDRLVVGRNDVVKKTIQLDRLAAPMQTAFNSILQESFMLRSVQYASPDHHDEILKNLVEFWIQAMKQPDGVKFDEHTLRDALLKRLQSKP